LHHINLWLEFEGKLPANLRGTACLSTDNAKPQTFCTPLLKLGIMPMKPCHAVQLHCSQWI
jgi:hypothetical protein